MKLWGGRFTKATDKSVEAFNASIQFDCRMYAEDICGSIAHATMLAKEGIISEADKDAIVKGLKGIFQQIEDGDFDFYYLHFIFNKCADLWCSTIKSNEP